MIVYDILCTKTLENFPIVKTDILLLRSKNEYNTND